MSITAVRPYFRARASTLQWKEWNDAFNSNNIPANLIDGSFHIELGQIGPSRTNQIDSEIRVPVQIKYFKKGFRDPAAGFDAAVAAAETYSLECMKAAYRLTGQGIKDVSLSSISFAQLGNNNDLVVATMVFNCLVILATT